MSGRRNKWGPEVNPILKPEDVAAQIAAGLSSKLGSQNNVIVIPPLQHILGEFEINDSAYRNVLTNKKVHDQLSSLTGVTIKLRGVFKQLGGPDLQPNERKLYLFLTAGSSDALGKALGMLYNCFSTGSIFASAQPSNPQSQQSIVPTNSLQTPQQPQLFHNFTSQFAAPTQQQQQQQQNAPPQQFQQQQFGQYSLSPQVLPAIPKPVYNCNARVSLGILSDARLDHRFNVKEKILGVGSQNMTHIENVTGVRAYLIGGGPLKGENGAWLEDFFLDLNAVSNEQLKQGIDLTSNLVETLRLEYVTIVPQPTVSNNTYINPNQSSPYTNSAPPQQSLPQQVPPPAWFPPAQQAPQQAVIPQKQDQTPIIHYVGFKNMNGINGSPHLGPGMLPPQQDQPYLHSQIRPVHPVHVPIMPVEKGRVPFAYPDSDGIVHVEGSVSTRHEEVNTGPVHYSDRKERPRENGSLRDSKRYNDDDRYKDDRYNDRDSSSSSRRYDGRDRGDGDERGDRRGSDRGGDRGGERGGDRGERGEYRNNNDRNSRDSDRGRDEKNRENEKNNIEKEILEVKKRKRGFQESAEYISPQDIPIPKPTIHNIEKNKLLNSDPNQVITENMIIDTDLPLEEDKLRIPTFSEPTESVLAALAAMTQRRKAKINRPLVPSFSESSPIPSKSFLLDKKNVSFSDTPLSTFIDKKETKISTSLLPGLIAYDDDDN